MLPAEVTVTWAGVKAGMIERALLDPEPRVADYQIVQGYAMEARAQAVAHPIRSHFKLRVEIVTQTDVSQAPKPRVWRAKFKTHGQHHAQKRVKLPTWKRKTSRIRIRKNRRKVS